MIISLLHPSRGRPQKAKSTYDYWMAHAAKPNRIQHILSLDFSDPTNEEYEVDPVTEKYTAFGVNSKTIIDHNDCVVEATNQAAQHATGNILVYMSDDIFPCQDWDLHITDIFDAERQRLQLDGSAFPMMLKVNDGHQPKENLILPVPIMNMELYKHLGYFFNPLYKSMFVDCDLYAVTKPYMVHVDILFNHIEGPDDETYQKSRAHFENGRTIFNERRAHHGWESPFKKAWQP